MELAKMSRLTKIMASAILLLGISFWPAHQLAAEESLEDWPARILSLAYILRNNGTSLEKIEAGEPSREFFGQELDQKFQKIMTLLASADTKSRPQNMLSWMKHYCWVKNHPGFVCGDPQTRKFDDGGFLYVTDPIISENSFIILILSEVAPAQTIILRLYSDKVELVHDRFDEEKSQCLINDSVSTLRVVYGMRTISDGVYELTESNNRHTEGWARKIELHVSESGCRLVQIDPSAIQ